MPHYDVTLLHDLSSHQRVQADSPADAVERACENTPSRLCHHCAGRYEMGDIVRAIVVDEQGDEVLEDAMGGAPAPQWLPIEQADTSRILLVNDTSGVSASEWVAAKYVTCPEWSGWTYEDDMLTDNNPLGPQPTHFYNVPAVPGAPPR